MDFTQNRTLDELHWPEFEGAPGFTRLAIPLGAEKTWWDFTSLRLCRSRNLKMHPRYPSQFAAVLYRGTPYCLRCARERLARNSGRYRKYQSAFLRTRSEVNAEIEKLLDAL